MFQVNVSMTVKVEGCPESGLAAVDYRKAMSLEIRPTDWVRIEWKFESESVCREFADYLDSNADLIVENHSNWPASPLSAMPYALHGKHVHCSGDHEVPANLIGDYQASLALQTAEVRYAEVSRDVANILRCIKERVQPILVRLREERAAEQAKREQETKDQEARDAVAKMVQQANEAERRAQEAQKRQEYEDTKRTWIMAFGSPHLRRLVEEGFSTDETYANERLAQQFPGWQWGSRVMGCYDVADDSVNEVTPEGIEILDQGRVFDAEAELVYWTVRHLDARGNADYEDDDIKDPPPIWEGYAVVAYLLERQVVFGVPSDLGSDED